MSEADLKVSSSIPVPQPIDPQVPPAKDSKKDKVSKKAKEVLDSKEKEAEATSKAPKAIKAVPVPKTPQVPRVKDPKKYDHDQLLKFYRNEIADIFGRCLEDFWKYTNKEKEDNHKYIQWACPIKTASGYQPTAMGPVLDDELIEKLQGDETVLKNFRETFDRMLEFYGLEYDEAAKKVKRAADFAQRSAEWLSPEDHNLKRITRILECSSYFCPDLCPALFDCLKEIKKEFPDTITEDTMERWCAKVPDLDWDEVKEEIDKAIEDHGFESTLRGLLKANKTTWIRPDLSIAQSSCLGRLLWCIAKYFDCLRRCLFGIDLKKSQEKLVEMKLKMIYEPKRYGRFAALYQKAVANYESIISEKHHVTFRKTYGKITFELTPGDITKEKVDVIVNAAKSSLKGGGGVDGAIHKAGGPAILKACKALVEAQKKAKEKMIGCDTGKAVITVAGKLKAKYVVHTVGPIWDTKKAGNNRGKDQQLYEAYFNSLELAHNHKAKSVSFPSISTGIYDFPLEIAAPVVARALTDFSNKHGQNTTIQTVRMLAFGQNIEDGVVNFIAYRDGMK